MRLDIGAKNLPNILSNLENATYACRLQLTTLNRRSFLILTHHFTISCRLLCFDIARFLDHSLFLHIGLGACWQNGCSTQCLGELHFADISTICSAVWALPGCMSDAKLVCVSAVQNKQATRGPYTLSNLSTLTRRHWTLFRDWKSYHSFDLFTYDDNWVAQLNGCDDHN